MPPFILIVTSTDYGRKTFNKMAEIDKKLFRDISYGMYFVTTRNQNNKNIGCVINTLTQITSTEPTISISLNKENYTNLAIKESKKFIVSIISEKTPKEAIGTFGYHTSKELNKFENVCYEEVDGLPILKEDTCGYLMAEVTNIIDCGTHDLIIGKVIKTQKENDNKPMTYAYYHQELKGKSPKNAPTYIEEDPIKNTGNQYRCTLCGYIYDDRKEKIKFEDLPDDWKCPLCGATKNQFEKINK